MLPDESPKLRHEETGLLSMSIADRDKFGSHFHITFRPNQQLDRFPLNITLFISGMWIFLWALCYF